MEDLAGLLFLLAAALVVLMLLPWFRRERDPSEHPEQQSAVEILRRRYAAGEISKEQFEEMRRTLRDPGS